jgi:Fic family protein
MKMPATPPAWLEHFKTSTLNTSAVTRLFGQSPTVKGRYVHWDKLRRLPPPKGWTSVDWWAALKFVRSQSLRPLPLRATNGLQFRLSVPDVALQMLHTLDRDAGAQILVSEEVINPETRRQYVISSLMEEAITSSQIEGAATTRQVAKEMLRTGRPPQTRDERMILNNYRAMQRIADVTKELLTPEVVFNLHRILGEDSLDVPDAAGRFRRPEENIDVGDADGQCLHRPPPAGELPDRMRAMCDFANEQTPEYFIHPVVRAIVLHFWLAYDHPFADGNGRCARALFYWSMLRSKYWLAEYLSISSVIRKAPVQYGRAFLYVETDEFDLTYFVLYHLDVVRRAIDELQAHLRRKMEEVREAEAVVSNGLNRRQAALLSHAVRHPDARYTIQAHQTRHNVVYQTARTDLLDLEERGLLQRTQVGKSFVFLVPPDLAKRIHSR